MTAIVEVPQENLTAQAIGRRNAVPIIYTRGTHYEIGFDIGRTFAKLIRDYVENYKPLNESYLLVYETPEGRRVYDETLACCQEQFPQYVREIEGTADGSEVPFYKLFLMHLDDILPNVAENGAQGNTQPVGCSSIICNHPGQEILGHNEDALSETLNHWYLVDAHVLEPGLPEEKFMSLSYAGFLPGYTMGYNHHGLVYSINTLSARTLRSGKSHDGSLASFVIFCTLDTSEIPSNLTTLELKFTPKAEVKARRDNNGNSYKVPMLFKSETKKEAIYAVLLLKARYFITRALLGVENYVQAQETLRNEGYGAAEGFSVNMTFLTQDGDRMFHNAEIGPVEPNGTCSHLSIHTASPGENLFHCNKYMRLKVPEVDGLIIESSIRRAQAIERHSPPKTVQEVIEILSDQTDNYFRVYQEFGPSDYVKTIATGIFDCIARTWAIYTDKPNCNQPMLVIPLRLKEDLVCCRK